jgi:hypothetical protein
MMILFGTKEDGTKVMLGEFNYLVFNKTCVCGVKYSTDHVQVIEQNSYLQFHIEERKEGK